MGARQAAPCIRCNEIVEINEAALVADIRLRTVRQSVPRKPRCVSA